MGISIGDRLGRIEILGAVGSGGMGDVYRARDLQLQREVALRCCRQVRPTAVVGEEGDVVGVRRRRRRQHLARLTLDLPGAPDIVRRRAVKRELPDGPLNRWTNEKMGCKGTAKIALIKAVYADRTKWEAGGTVWTGR
jgi:hypothetical protein